MKHWILCLLAFSLSVALKAKTFSGALNPAPPGYCISIEEVITHDTGELEGQTTYRLYLNCLNETDYLSSCSGDENNPLVINSSSGTWYNNALNAGWNALGVNPAFFFVSPDLAYDSFLTIGAEDALTPAGQHPYMIGWGDIDVSAAFVPGPGFNIVVNDETGGAWYSPFPGADASDSHVAFAGPDLKILIMQITTAGQVSGQAQMQVFMNADLEQEWRNLLVFGFCEGPGCLDEEACNYNEEATEEDGSCVYPEDYYDCEGNCLNDEDADGVCDELEILGCLEESACNFNPDATDSDDSCAFPGDACDDGDDTTVNDAYTADCDCLGEVNRVDEFAHWGIALFPTPVQDVVHLQFRGEAQGLATLVIQNAAGQIVRTDQLLGDASVDISALSGGVYFVSVKGTWGVATRRVVVARGE